MPYKMAKTFILFVLLPHLLCTMVHGTTSCSEYFTYTIDPETRKIFGRIEILSPQRTDEFHLKLALKTIADPLTNRSSELTRLELLRPITETIIAVEHGEPLLYQVNFPSNIMLPTLSAVWFNDHLYCLGPGASNGNITANLELGHIVYPPDNELSQKLQWWYRNSSTYLIDDPTYDSSSMCGITNYDIDKLFLKAENTSSVRSPWVVAIFSSTTTINGIAIYGYRCAGSLLTNRHIITVAHCLKDFGTNGNVPLHLLEVIVGQLMVHRLHEDTTINPEVKSYKIHPDYRDSFNADSDLAILTLRKPITYNPAINPLCLWSSSSDLRKVANKIGYFTGWDQNEVNRIEIYEQRMMKTKIVNQDTCLLTDARYVPITSNRTFCAALLAKAGHLENYSGNGLVLLNNITGRYELRGIVSRHFEDLSNRITSNYIVYIDVAKYIPWIQQQILM
ncbi:PREDICTED: serine protease gd-like isoform X2 [Vollenhovia emeryi]|uniref:serine protease gd-like isoform X2 n=1 Tax=Vollenhovia emeryi TaxID=411798 RepID=UPI0005F54BA3|nr:PREDICTED: serine protease gd-like isoform X2 [Vollenhovia emeryi]